MQSEFVSLKLSGCIVFMHSLLNSCFDDSVCVCLCAYNWNFLPLFMVESVVYAHGTTIPFVSVGRSTENSILYIHLHN